MNSLPLQKKVASVVLAGGLGTRLYPLTKDRCKPAVSFAGKYRLIDIPVSNSLNSRIEKIFVISQHLVAGLQKHLKKAYPSHVAEEGGIKILFPEETKEGTRFFAGTADAVRKNLAYLNDSDVEYFLILSGDQLYHIDLLKMVEFASERQADLVIAALPVEGKDAGRMGLLRVSSDSRIVDFIEKPKDPDILRKFTFCRLDAPIRSCYLGSMGMYVFRKEALLALLEEEGDDFGKDLIPLQVRKGNTYAFVYDGYWEDIGTVDSYYAANLALLENRPRMVIDDPLHPIRAESLPLPISKVGDTKIENSIIGQGCSIFADMIEKSVIGLQVAIGKGTVVKESVVIGSSEEGENTSVSIGENCFLHRTIVDEGASIGNNVTLKNERSLSAYDGEGIFIRDGIIVVASGTRVPDGFCL